VLYDLDRYDGHIVRWKGVGPFQDPSLQDGQALYAHPFPPESTPPDSEAWQPVTRGVGDWSLNLEEAFGNLDYCVAYLQTDVWSPADQPARLEMGSDDGVRAWINGELVFDQYGGGGVNPRQHRAPIQLKSGWNRLVLKVVDHEGSWGVCCRVRGADGSAIPDLRFEPR